MGYIIPTQIGLVLPFPITASSNPNFEETGSIIARISAMVDGVLQGQGYTTPVAGTASTAYLQCEQWTMWGVGCEVLGIMFPNEGGPSDSISLRGQYCMAYQNAMAMVAKGTLTLVGVSPESDIGREMPRSYPISHPDATSGVDPIITMGRVF